MSTIQTLPRPWFWMLPDTMERMSSHDDFGLAHAERRERIRLREREKKRRHRARAAAKPVPPAKGPDKTVVSTFITASGIRAFTEPEARIIIRGMNHRTVETWVSLPFVSILRGEG